MLSENQLYISATPKDFTPTGLDNTQSVSPVGTYTISPVSSNRWITGENISGYAYVMSRDSSATLFNTDNWAITFNERNEFSILYSGDGAVKENTYGTEFFCSGINEEGNGDIYLPSGWSSDGVDKFEIEINDKFFQHKILNEGSSDLSYKITKDISLSYVKNLDSAQSLEYNTFEGWEVDIKDEGLFSYYIKLNENDQVNNDFVFVDRGPIFYISRFFIDAFYKQRDPSFDIENPKNILFKKGSTNISGQSFSDRDYDEAPIINPTGTGNLLTFGDPSWFLNESYIMKEIPSQTMFDAQEEINIVERDGAYKPTRENLIQFENDSTLSLSPITGYYSFSNSTTCEYAKNFFEFGENRNWYEDWESNNNRYLNYLTTSNFLYNVIRRMEVDSTDIGGTELETFLVSRLGENYLTEKEISLYIKDSKKVKIGYNKNCNVFQRRLFYYGGSNAYVEWSLHHKNTNDNTIIHDAVYRRVYEINESFTYNNVNYSVVDFVPFEDFGMEPIDWSR